jgi:hypothetical protein
MTVSKLYYAFVLASPCPKRFGAPWDGFKNIYATFPELMSDPTRRPTYQHRHRHRALHRNRLTNTGYSETL